jgi:hypothetical protein
MQAAPLVRHRPHVRKWFTGSCGNVPPPTALASVSFQEGQSDVVRPGR